MFTFTRPPHAHKSGGFSALITLTLGATLAMNVACESPKRELLNTSDINTPVGGALLPPMAGELMAGEPMAGELMAGEPMAGEPMAGEPMAGEPMAGEPMGGMPPLGGMPPVEPPEDCFSNEDFFEQRVWREVLKPQCLDCHNQQGAALTSEMVFVRDELPGALEQNYETFSHIAAFDQSGYPLVLLKPTNRLPHGGGELITEGDASYELLREMVERTRDPEPVVCTPEEVEGVPSIFEGVTLLGPHETLRRAIFSLSGRLPTASEEALVTSHGWGGLEQALEGMFRSEGFDRRLKEIWNDILLTDKYLGGTEAIDPLNPTTYPPARWFMGGP